MVSGRAKSARFSGGATSDQRRFVQQEQRLVRNQRALGGNLHQVGKKRTRQGHRHARTIRGRIMAAIVMMRLFMMIAVVRVAGMIVVTVVIMILVGMRVGAFVVAFVNGGMDHTRRHPCENAEKEKNADNRHHEGLLEQVRAS